MKTPIVKSITRASLTATAAHNARWFACIVAGTTVLGSTTALALDNFWTGAVSNDWNNTGNWSLNRVPAFPNGNPSPNDFDDAVINTLTNFPVLTANPSAVPRDIRVGNVSGATGRVDNRAGTSATGAGNWMFVGVAGGTGTFNLANTAGTGGTFTGFAQGTGSLTVGGASGSGARLYVGGDDSGGDAGNGTLNVNTSGVCSATNDLVIGSQGGTGLMNLDNGTVTSGNASSGAWIYIGQEGGNGTLNMSGGSMSVFGRFYVGRNGGATGTVNMTGGSIVKNTGDPFIVAENSSTGVFNQSGGTVTTSGGEFWVGQGASSNGTYNLSSGSLTVGNWVAIGRDGGTGAFNMTGGTFTKVGAADQRFIVGASGPGTWVQSAGLVDIQTSEMWLGENATGTYTLSGTGELRTPGDLYVGRNGGGTGTLNLNGGTLRTSKIVGQAGSATVSFNGTQIVATSIQPTNFIDGMDTATIGSGGLLVNSNGFNLTAPQVLGGTGGVVKSGAGTLTLLGANTFTGSTTVNAGKVVVSTVPSGHIGGDGAFSIANNAGMGVRVNIDGEQRNAASATFGTGTSVDIVLDNASGNPSVAPLNIVGTATLAGNVAVNLTDAFPEVGTYTLIDYGTKSAPGGVNFVLGTLPQGVVGTLSDNGSIVTLNVTSVSLPKWDATVNGNWNDDNLGAVNNWIDQITSASIKYTNGNPVLFDDIVTGATQGNVTITELVTPGSVTFNNNGVASSGLDYVIGASGAGAIGGTTGITKQGSGDVNLTTNHSYTGVTRLEGGTLTTALLTNGGAASPIGAASADPANISFGGGTLNYTGPTVTTNRGYSISAADGNVVSGLINANNLTISGAVTAPALGKFLKTGAGTLTLTNAGANVLANGPGTGGTLRVDGGTLTLNGSGTQTNQVNGELWLASAPDVAANMTLSSTSLTITSWLAMGRGNGTTNTVSNLTATSSTIQTGNFSTGFDAGLAGNSSTQNVTLTSTNWTNNGITLLAESAGATSNVTIQGTSAFVSNDRLLIGLGQNSVANVTLNDSGSINKIGGWFSIGNSSNGVGTLTLNDNSVVTSAGDFNIGDVDTSSGTLNIHDSASITSTGQVFIGKNTGTSGTINQDGGTFTGTGWVSGARFSGSTGAVNVSGGTFNQTGLTQALFVAEEGTGVMTLSGTGAINVAGTGLVIANAGTGVGTFNLDGGTLTVRQVFDGNSGAGSSTFNFDGGTLRAGTGATANFMSGLDVATVEDGGAIIDSNGNTINIGQGLQDGGTGGGLTKNGTGTLRLNGVNTYTGVTQVNAGALGGTGLIAGNISVAAGASLAPGAPTGTLTANAVTFAATAKLSITIDNNASPVNGEIEATGNLNITNANLELIGTPTLATYVIARYGTLTGAAFASIPSLPAGYTVNYNYQGLNQIAIVRPPTAFESWIDTYFPGETDPAIVGADADPDGDGGSNRFEFALGGIPNDPASQPKIFPLALDSSDVGTNRELLLTIAVRSTAPVFTGSPSPTSTVDGITYTIQGSLDLVSFPTAVSVVTPVTPSLPALPSGYQYRTFSLNGSDGLPSKGFLRVTVTP